MHRALFYEFHEADPTTDRFTHTTAKGDVTIVLAGDPAKIPTAAAELADAGVELIELCGGVPLALRVSVKALAHGKARVASVMFGIESIVQAAEFKRAFMAGKPPSEACILQVAGADPSNERFVRSSGPQNTTFVMSDERVAAGAACVLADQGVGLIELYGGFSDDVAAAVIAAVAGRAAVGVSCFGH